MLINSGKCVQYDDSMVTSLFLEKQKIKLLLIICVSCPLETCCYINYLNKIKN